jgi:hypothetical protein
MLNVGPISWKSRRQDSVDLSTSEAEYMAASPCGQEVVYIRAILRDFGVTQTQPTLVYEDNLACIVMSVNPVSRKCSRTSIFVATIFASCVEETYLSSCLYAPTLWSPTPSQRASPRLALSVTVVSLMGHSDFQVRLLHAVRGG